MASFMEEDLSEYEMTQRKNIKIIDDFVNEEKKKLKLVATNNEDNSTNNTQRKPKVKPGGSRSRDSTFTFRGSIPKERRTSNRLKKKAIVYNFQDANDELEFQEGQRKREENGADRDYQIKKKRNSTRSPAPPVTMSVEKVTSSYLSNVSYKVSEKTYSQQGTTCHQCRQKTLDSKTVCRNLSCIGVRGQFCGVCLRNRYGENANDALLDPGWSCPPCRDICNCSICRSRKGINPTGILVNKVKKSGHTNAKDFLISEDMKIQI